MENLMDYDTLMRIISNIPSCIFFKDTEARYVFATHYWKQLNASDGDFDICGKTDLDIRKDKENAMLALEADKRMLATGEGSHYTIKDDADGILQYLELKKECVRDRDGNIIGIVGLINDVTETVLLHENLKYLSSYDMLTEIYNRKTGTDIIDDILKDSTDNKFFCVIDIDDFKIFNDTYGHLTGDAVLKAVAACMRDGVNEDSVVCRLGGDEFAILLNGYSGREEVEQTIDDIFSAIKQVDIPEIKETEITLSVGMTEVCADDKLDKLYSTADYAMYTAKKEKGSHLCWY